MILPTLAWRFIRHTRPRLLANFAWRLGVNGAITMHRFHRQQKQGRFVPPFWFISVTSRCNLQCQGCWVRPDRPADMSPQLLDRLLTAAKRNGLRFVGLLGGEPLLHAGLLDVLARHRDLYVLLFTNGTTLTGPLAERMARLGNITPLVSIEGDDLVSDRRRGGNDVLNRSLAGLDAALAAGLPTGVATSLCRSNLETLLSERFIDSLIDRGVLYLWYYLYRPVGPDPQGELALDEQQILRVRQFLLQQRRCKPILLIDAYWDADGRAICPAATGLSHHITPSGQVEPCPPIQFAADTLAGAGRPEDVLADSTFLADFRTFAAATTPGCILLDNPAALADWIAQQQPADTTGRSSGPAELAAMTARPSHHLPGREIPETHWAYRLAKRFSFFGLGAYG